MVTLKIIYAYGMTGGIAKLKKVDTGSRYGSIYWRNVVSEWNEIVYQQVWFIIYVISS